MKIINDFKTNHMDRENIFLQRISYGLKCDNHFPLNILYICADFRAKSWKESGHFKGLDLRLCNK